jgi:hypothetical protein
MGPENSRISLGQLGFVVLGCVFSQWQEFGKTIQCAATWLHDIVELIQPALRRTLSHIEFSSHWLNYLDHAAQNLLSCTDVDIEFANKLVGLGKRRSDFIYAPNIPVQPLFGLSDLAMLVRLMVSSETRVASLRKIASQLKPNDEKYDIGYRPSDIDKIDDYHHFEFATVRPHITSSKRTYYGLLKTGSSDCAIHTRWLPFNPKQFADCSCHARYANSFRLHSDCLCEYTPWRFKCALKNCTDVEKCQNLQHTPFWLRYETIKQIKEDCLSVLDEEQEGSDGGVEYGLNLRFTSGTSFEYTF